MTDMRSYMKGIQDVIGHVLVNEGISARCLRVKQGPMTINYQIQLITPKRGDDDKLMKLVSMLEYYTSIAPVRISRELAKLVIEFPSPKPVTPHARMLANLTRGSTICIGFDRWGEPTYLSLPSFPNLLVSGPPRSGKSSAMRSILYAAIKSANTVKDAKVEFAIFAEKVTYWSAFEPIQGFAGLFATQAEALAGLGTIVAEMRELVARQDRFRPAKILILDDLTSLLSGNAELAEDLSAAVSTGGSAGLYVLIGTQTTGSRAGTGGQRVEDSILARLIYRTSSRSSAARATGGGAEDIDQLTLNKGDALLVLGSQATRVATGYVDDLDIARELPRRNRSPRYSQVRTSLLPDKVLDKQIKEGGVRLGIEPPQLPKIKPARAFTPEEAEQVLNWIRYQNEMGQPWSKRAILFSVFDGKNGVLDKYLAEVLANAPQSQKEQIAKETV